MGRLILLLDVLEIGGGWLPVSRSGVHDASGLHCDDDCPGHFRGDDHSARSVANLGRELSLEGKRSKASRWWAAAVRQQRPATVLPARWRPGFTRRPGAGPEFEGGLTRGLLRGIEQQIKSLRARIEVLALVLAFASWSACVNAAFAQPASLTISSREASRTYFAHDLLADPSVRDLRISNDPIYQASKVYRVVPMERLLRDITLGVDDYVQVRATDNFSASIPAALLKPTTRTGTEAFLAIENSAAPWPPIPGKQGSAGPFFIVWQSAKAPVARTYWVYRVAALTVTDSPHKRWPNLRMPDALPASDPAWRGRDRFVALCMACHRFNGDGEGDAGPDLATPMSPVDYFQPSAFKLFLRNPSAVRSWPAQKMPAFDEATLSNADLDAIVAWLTYKRRSAPPQKAKP